MTRNDKDPREQDFFTKVAVSFYYTNYFVFCVLRVILFDLKKFIVRI